MGTLLRSRMFRQQFIIHSLYFIIVLGILFYQVGMQTIKELETQQEHLANVYRDQLEASLTGWYGGQRSTLKALSKMLESMSGKELASPTITALISNILAAYPEVSDLVIIDSQGTIVNARTKTANTGAYNLADRPYFKTALEQGEGGSGFFCQ